jgi:hypothetical protein
MQEYAQFNPILHPPDAPTGTGPVVRCLVPVAAADEASIKKRISAP